MTLQLKPLAEQVIVITGASSGIGLVTAKLAASRGAKVVLVARNEGSLTEAVEAIRAALRTMPQVQHRLNVTLHGAGGGLLDDAYNSNPEGFREAIRTIDIVADGGKLGRRIVITPGMVELGEIHDQKHREIGEQMQGKVDVALLVRSDRLQSLIEGARAGPGPAPEIVEVASETEARAWLANHGQANDYVLFENSVPDLYETKLFL